MPSAMPPQPLSLPQWHRPSKTEADLQWADISVIDISTFDKPGEKERLAEELRHAVNLNRCSGWHFHTDVTSQVETTRFFSITGTGFTEEEVTRQYSIGQAFFNRPLEEKNKPELRCDFGKGNYFGYRAVSPT